ncbi:hypothetical protein D3C78_868320 [compost metagenome]
MNPTNFIGPSASHLKKDKYIVKRIGYKPNMAKRIKNGEIKVYAVSRLRLVSVQKRRFGGAGWAGLAVAVSAISAPP